jgi:hypothetical protein
VNEFEIVKHIMMLDHISYDDLSERLGYKSKSSSYIILDHKHIYVDTWRKFLDELGYEIVVRKKGKNTGGYVIDNDNTPSPLRFHDMSLNLDAIFGDTKKIPACKQSLSVGERNLKSEALKKKVNSISFFECENELRDIWSIESPTPDGKQSHNEYEQEYERYREELCRLYNQSPPPVETKIKPSSTPKRKRSTKKKEPLPMPPIIESTGAHGKVITEVSVSEKDMSYSAVRERAEKKQHEQRSLLLNLTADFKMDD